METSKIYHTSVYDIYQKQNNRDNIIILNFNGSLVEGDNEYMQVETMCDTGDTYSVFSAYTAYRYIDPEEVDLLDKEEEEKKNNLDNDL